MASVPLTLALRKEYQDLFATCSVAANRAKAVEGLVDGLLANQARYQTVAAALGVPWTFIAVIHNMESGQSFDEHLHNGDPLTARTVHIPAGRPKTGAPPFTWEASAKDALTMHHLGVRTDWTLAGTLYQAELYNGFGYRLRHPEVKSPYLWGYSNHYTAGKYVADRKWSATAVTDQCGAAVLLRRLAERGHNGFTDQAPPPADGTPLVVPYSLTKPTDPAKLAQVIALQTWLSTHPGVLVKPDGAAGDHTSDAYKLVTGHHLPGDPRGD